MLTLDNLTGAYGEKEIVSKLNFAFPKSGIVAIMGPSGCGKTTLFRLICGLERPTAGLVKNTYQKNAVMFQEPRLLPWCDLTENIAIALPKDSDRLKKAEQYLEKVELGHAKHLFPHELSGGMKTRVSLARALAFEGDLLLLDEPFTGMDQALRQRMTEVVKTSCPNGLTVVITHNREDAELLGATVFQTVGRPITDLVPLC